MSRFSRCREVHAIALEIVLGSLFSGTVSAVSTLLSRVLEDGARFCFTVPDFKIDRKSFNRCRLSPQINRPLDSNIDCTIPLWECSLVGLISLWKVLFLIFLKRRFFHSSWNNSSLVISKMVPLDNHEVPCPVLIAHRSRRLGRLKVWTTRSLVLFKLFKVRLRYLNDNVAFLPWKAFSFLLKRRF